ncbi:MAG: lactonase family protein [Clostridia bacterium]|nr:lactonase family protein [Clostridia bacterium]
MDFYVGTLTREGGEGILSCRLTKDGIDRVGCYAQTADPNYLIWSSQNRRLYATGSDTEEGFRGSVSELKVENGQFQLVSRQKTDGNGPCFLTMDRSEKYLYCANYGTGSLCVFPARPFLGAYVQQVRHTGRGPHPQRQEGPHTHQITFVPGTELVLAVDLGADEIWLYHADPKSGKLEFRSKCLLHGGPRHVAYGKTGCVYLAHELSSEVTALRLEGETLTPLQTLSTLPEGEDVQNTASAIRISGDGRRLYVSNRGHGSIAAYEIVEDGTLRFLTHYPAGIYPRDFQLLPDGGFLVADQRAGVRRLNSQGKETAFLPQMGAVCICIPEDTQDDRG